MSAPLPNKATDTEIICLIKMSEMAMLRQLSFVLWNIHLSKFDS